MHHRLPLHNTSSMDIDPGPGASHSQRFWPRLYLLLYVALALVATCYVIQIFTPLRLNTDAIVLLSMADSATLGMGFTDYGQRTVFPPGYPALLALVLASGLKCSSTVVAINLLALTAGLFFTYRIVENVIHNATLSLVVCLLSLLSYVIIKHITLPLTDIVFLGLVMSCLAVMSYLGNASSGKTFTALVVASWVLMLFAILVRRNGVALVPPFIYALISHPKIRLWPAHAPRNRKLAGAVLCLGAILLLALAVAATSTLVDFNSTMTNSGLLPTLFRAFQYRVTELGELFINIPASKAPSIARWLLPWLGVFGFFVVLAGYVQRRKSPSAVDVYFGATLLILFAWPYNDARFWIPVIPLLIAYATLALRPAAKWKLAKVLVGSYLTVFVLTGVAALAYSTRITFAGSRFPDLYGDGTLRSAYCAALYQCQEGAADHNVDAKTMRLLRICQ